MRSTEEFLQAVLPADGLPCLAWLNGSGGMHHHVFSSLNEFVQKARRLTGDKQDLYFCISTLSKPSVERQQPDGTAKTQVRVQTNAHATKAFVLDVDIRADDPKFCPNRASALADLDIAVESFGLPQPIVVNSGNGLHVYWPLKEAIPSAEWTATARRFKKALQITAPRLVADGTRVADCAGVLRLPNTLNHKGGESKPVVIDQWYSEPLDMKKLLSKLGVAGAPVSTAPNTLAPASTPSEPVSLAKVAKGCNWTAHYLRTKATASEPEWYAMLGLVPFLAHRALTGDALAQSVSKGHTGYSEQATTHKLQQVMANQSGPTTCERFQSIDPSHCKGCPFAASVKTPIQIARLRIPVTSPEKKVAVVHEQGGVESVQEVTIPVPPKPYFRGEDGGVFVRENVKNPDTKQWEEVVQRVYDHDLYLTQRVRGETTSDERIEVHLWLPLEGIVKFWLPTELLADPKALFKALAAKGVIPEADNQRRLVKYFIDYARHLQTVQVAATEVPRFGWRAPGGEKPRFVLSEKTMTHDGQEQISVAAPKLRDIAHAASAKGSLAVWKRAFDAYRAVPDAEPYIFTALLGFAAPLMAMTEYHGVMVNLVGPSGAGKSTALKFMSSVFGRPNPQHVLVTDTDIAVFNQIGSLSDIAVAFDEVTKLPEDRLGNFILNFTGGRGKNRAMRNGDNKLNDVQWNTIVASTSNSSLYEKTAAARRSAGAEAMRIYEMQVEAPRPEYKVIVDDATRKLVDNYGIAGERYAAYLAQHARSVKSLLDAAIHKLTAQNNLPVEERFWGALIGAVYVGASIAAKLGLHTYDAKKITAWAMGASKEAREVVSREVVTPQSLISEFINASLDGVLRVTKGTPDAIQATTLRKLVARAELLQSEERRVWISRSAFRDWCKLHRADASTVLRDLKRSGMLVDDRVIALNAGTAIPGGRIRAFCISFGQEPTADALFAGCKIPT